MRYARTRFWIAALLTGIVWLAALIEGGKRSQWDQAYRRLLYAAHDPDAAQAAAWLTLLGNGIVLSVIAVAASVFLYFHRRMRAALLLFTVFGGRLFVELQKLIAGRERPGVAEHLEVVYSLSFPSAHAANATITLVTVALLVPVRQRNRALAVAIAVILALAVGWSRVALGVHWPSDVVGGWAFGLFWVALCMRLASARPDAEPSAAER